MRQLNVNLRKQLDAGESAESNLLLKVSDVTVSHRLHGTISYIQQVKVCNFIRLSHSTKVKFKFIVVLRFCRVIDAVVSLNIGNLGYSIFEIRVVIM